MNARIHELLADLEDEERVYEAARALVELGREGVDPVLALVGDPKRSTLGRIYAAIVLGEVKDPRVVPELIHVLGDSDDSWQVRRRAAWALGQIGDQRAKAALLKALEDDKHPDVRGFAAQALGKLGLTDAIPALIAHLTDDEEMDDFSPVSTAVLGAVGMIGGAEADEALLGVIEAWLPALPTVGAVFGSLIGIGPVPDSDLMCAAAVGFLAERGNPSVLPNLRQLFNEAQSPFVKHSFEVAVKTLEQRARGNAT